MTLIPILLNPETHAVVLELRDWLRARETKCRENATHLAEHGDDDYLTWADMAEKYCVRADAINRLLQSPPLSPGDAMVEKKLWLWKNFVEGRPEYWAFDNPYPVQPNGDPMTFGEPCGYAIVKFSAGNGRPDKSEQEVVAAILAAIAALAKGEGKP